MNIISTLFPFLPQLSDVAAASSAAKSSAESASLAVAAAAAGGGNAREQRAAEEQAVRAFLQARLPGESLHCMGAAAVENMTSDPFR